MCIRDRVQTVPLPLYTVYFVQLTYIIVRLAFFDNETEAALRFNREHIQNFFRFLRLIRYILKRYTGSFA